MTETITKKAGATRKAPTKKPEQTVEVVENEFTEEVEVAETAITEDGKTVGIIAVDNGGDNTKVFTENMDNPTHFTNVIAKGKEVNLSEPVMSPEHHSHVVEWNGQIYLTNLRTSQSKFKPMTSYKESKSDDFFILSTLLAVAKYGYDINYLVTSVPYINYHGEKGKKEIGAIRERLLGQHTISIDNVEYNFEIAGVEASAEAQAGHFFLQDYEFYYGEGGLVTLLEIGSRTVGVATNDIILDPSGQIIHVNPIEQKTDTLTRMGVKINNLTESEYIDYASSIFSELSDMIDENARVFAFGGGVLIDAITEGLENEFNNITFLEEPLYVQVRGMLNFAQDVLYRNLYTEEDSE